MLEPSYGRDSTITVLLRMPKCTPFDKLATHGFEYYEQVSHFNLCKSAPRVNIKIVSVDPLILVN